MDYKKQPDEEAVREILETASPEAAPPPGLEERILKKMLEHYGAAASHPRPKARPFWQQLAWRLAPAMTALALLAAGAWFFLGGNVREAKAGFALMLQRIHEAKSVVYTQVSRVPGQAELRGRITMALPGKVRTTLDDGTVLVTNLLEGQSMKLSPSRREATLIPNASGNTRDDPLERLANVAESAGHFVRTGQLNGRRAWLYKVHAGEADMDVWVDPRTNLPLLIEEAAAALHGERATTELRDFIWDGPVSEADFAFTVPEGYALKQMVGNPTEEALVTLLRLCAEMNNGAFPDRLDRDTVLQLVLRRFGASRQVDPSNPILTPTHFTTEGEAVSKQCLAGLAFIDSVRDSHAWEYDGKGDALGDAKAVVCRWTNPKSGKTRLVRGDLRVGDQ